MFKMLRVRQILNLTSFKHNLSVPSSQSVFNGILTRSSINSFARPYCQKRDEGKVGGKNKQPIKSHPSIESRNKTDSLDTCKLRECKPVEFIPCQPPSSPIQSIKDCPPRSLMDEMPEPCGDWKRKDDYYRNRNKRWLILGILFTAFTLGTVWFIGPLTWKGAPEQVPAKKKRRIVCKNPENSDDIPNNVPYLLIGGGTASFTAFRAIKSFDPTAKVLIISNENFYPYMRPPLSKEIWFNDDKESVKNRVFKQWNGSERSLFYEPEDFYTNCDKLMEAPNGGVSVARGWTVSKLDVIQKKAVLENGAEIKFGKCLIATGAKPKLSPVFEAAKKNERTQERVQIYRDINDFEDAYDMFETASDVAIVGGGFLGSELACAMARKDKCHEKNIYQIFKESGNMGKILPEYLSFWTTDRVKDEGVKVLAQSEVIGVKEKEDKIQLSLSNGKSVTVDYVVVAVGARPNTDLSESSGLEVDPELGGYLVNTELQARTDVYIAGDCACFYDTKLGRRRFEHHDHAVVTGRLAGENMTGARRPYLHQSMFWSDLGPDVGYEAIGIVDSTLPTVAVFAKATEKDNPRAVVMATNEGIRSKTEQIPLEGKGKTLTPEEQQRLDKAKKDICSPDLFKGEDYGKGVIFYLKNDIVVGIVLWNVFNRMNIARQVLLDHKKYDDLNEVAKLFTIHEE